MILQTTRKKLGEWGENVAQSYLIDHGYQVIGRNFRSPYGEMDIIARDGSVWCFIEVKTRKNRRYGPGYHSVNRRKQNHLIQTAEFYLISNNLSNVPLRFDIISIDFIDQTEYRVELIRNAFIRSGLYGG